MQRTIYRMKGTIAYLSAEIEASGVKREHISERPALLVCELGYFKPKNFIPPSISYVYGQGPISIPIPVQKPWAVCTITAVEEPGETMRLTVEIEDDPATTGYAKVHDRWNHLRAHLGSRLVEPQPVTAKRGMKMGTEARVREMHRLLKMGISQRQAKKQAECDPNTYYRWCHEVTGEHPIR